MQLMNRLLFGIALAIPASLSAQSTTAASSRIPATPAADATVVLNPFVISTARESGWVASNTLVGSRTNEELANLPMSVDVLTGDFLRDLNAYTLDEAATWIAGLNVVPLLESRNDEDRTIYRGQSIGDGQAGQSSRNFFLWYSPTDNYNIERIDFNKGSNSLMFGDASPGGQATTYTKLPRFENFGSFTAQYGSYGSHRVQFDWNRRINDQVAVRLNAVERSTRSYVDFNESALRAIDLAAIYRPFKNTTIRAEFEGGEFSTNRVANQITVNTLAAPGRGFNTIGTRAYYTSDGEIVLRSPNTGTIVSPSAGDRLASGGDAFSLLEGQTQAVDLRGLNAASTAAVLTGRTLRLSGFDQRVNLLGADDYLKLPYSNASGWMTQSVGKLTLELAYNQQNQTHRRMDTPYSTIVKVDGTGRPYVEQDRFDHKDLGHQTKMGRLTVSYPFEFGRWMKQFVVFTTTRQADYFHIFRQSLANVAVEDNGPAVPLVNNLIGFRAYLDTPAIYGRAFWEKLSPRQLPTTPTFRAGWYSYSDTINPFWTVRYQKTYSFSASGQYFGGKVRSLLGARYDEFSLKKTAKLTSDAFGNAIDPGGPHVAPDAFAYDPLFDLSNWTLNGGLVYTLTKSLNAYGTYSESYRWQGSQDYSGKLLGPVLGSTKEFGLKGHLLDHRLTYTIAVYQTDRENASFLWTPNVLNQTQLEDVVNPNNLLPSDPAYFHVPIGIRQEQRTTTASERSRGVETTLQLQRFNGVQARLTFSRNEILANRDFSLFKIQYEAATQRTHAALAPGGNPALAENATFLASMKSILEANLGVLTVTGLRSRPSNVNWVLDYEFARNSRLRGTRVSLNGQWGSAYSLANLGGVIFEDDATHPVGMYILHRRKLWNYATTVRLGVTNLVDLETGNSRWRHTGVVRVQTDGTPIYQYRYTNPSTWNLTTTVDF